MINSVVVMFQGTVALLGMVVLGIFGQVEQVDTYKDSLMVHMNLRTYFAVGGIIFAGDTRAQNPNRHHRHEYGHILQERQLGLLYLPVVAVPSILYALGIINRPYVEQWATELGEQ